MNEFESAEVVKDKDNKQYHLGLKPGDIAEKVILVGDPKRAEKIAGFFDEIKFKNKNREFLTFTGLYKGIELSVISVGIGAGAMEIVVIELCQLRFPVSIIRCGTCGALQDNIDIADLIITSGAYALENTTHFYVDPAFPALSSYEINMALLKAADQLSIPHHFGITATAPGFYGSQGRHVPNFPLLDDSLIDRITKQGVKNLEMECSTLLKLATFRGFRAGAVCVAFASRPKNKFINPDKKEEAESKAINTTLKAFTILDKMDKEKKDKKYWLPDL